MLSICDQNYKVFLHLGLSNCLNNLKDKTNLYRIIIISCIISIVFKTRPNRPRTDDKTYRNNRTDLEPTEPTKTDLEPNRPIPHRTDLN